MLSEWDDNKRQPNLAKHHIDFQDAQRIFDGPVFEKTSTRRGERRVLAIGSMGDVVIVVVYVMRGSCRRLISARKAHSNERKDYSNHLKLAR